MDQISRDLKATSLKYALWTIGVLIVLIAVISIYHKQSSNYIDNNLSDPNNIQEKIIFDNIKIKINNDVFSYDQICNEVNETGIIEYLNKNLKKGDTIIYVSQDVGVQQLLMAKLISQSGRIYVLNPFEKYNNTIALSAQANGFDKRIFTKTVAISDKIGEGLLVYKKDVTPEYGILKPTDYVLENGYNALHVNITSLDVLYPNLQNINLLRISMKKGAFDVINGAKQIIKRSPDIKIIFDYAKDEPPSTGDLKHLQEQGFDIYEIDETGAITPANINNLTTDNIMLQHKPQPTQQNQQPQPIEEVEQNKESVESNTIKAEQASDEKVEVETVS